MNDRIQECWLRAAREDSGDKWDTQEEFIERFARLIVHEVFEMIDDEQFEMYPPVVQRVKERFGISDDVNKF
jgi:predicted house-cleaning noncanonical NTP pyrophosphatase (MazG superfamily)